MKIKIPDRLVATDFEWIEWLDINAGAMGTEWFYHDTPSGFYLEADNDIILLFKIRYGHVYERYNIDKSTKIC